MCTNAKPDDFCVCALGEVFRIIGFRAILKNWNIIGRAFSGSDCRNLKLMAQCNDRQDLCCGGSNYSSGNYGFATKKRSDDPNVCTSTGVCKAVQNADLIVL